MMFEPTHEHNDEQAALWAEFKRLDAEADAALDRWSEERDEDKAEVLRTAYKEALAARMAALTAYDAALPNDNIPFEDLFKPMDFTK